MARTLRNVWPQLTSWENVYLAWHRCRRRKRFKPEACAFAAAWQPNLVQLRRELLNGTWRPGRYRHFRIVDPKPRKISAAPFRDRIVHHAVVQVLEPFYERRFLYDSYACRRGKGTHRAVERARGFVRRNPFCLKTDIVRFFPCVDHAVLWELLQKHIRDDQVMSLIQQLIASGEGILTEEAPLHWFAGDDLLAPLRPRGMPIGNLTSQFFANVLLDPLDHYIKEDLRIPGYVRYADDLLLFADSKAELWHAYESVVERLAELRLKLHPEKTQVLRCDVGVKFLGFVIRPDEIRLQQRTIRRFSRRLRLLKKQFARGEITAREVGVSLRAWRAFIRTANSKGIARDLWKRVVFQRKRESPE